MLHFQVIDTSGVDWAVRFIWFSFSVRDWDKPFRRIGMKGAVRGYSRAVPSPHLRARRLLFRNLEEGRVIAVSDSKLPLEQDSGR